MDSNEFKYLSGKIDAVALLCSTLAAELMPGAAEILLRRISALRASADDGKADQSYVAGFCSFETEIREGAALVAAAHTLSREPGGAGN